MIRTLTVSIIFVVASLSATAQKSVFIPDEFNRAPLNEWSSGQWYESDNFFIVWGNKAGTTPASNIDSNVRFDPAQIAAYLEASYRLFVTELRFVSDSANKNLGRYKIIVVMTDTYEGPNGPTGWGYAASYGKTIGGMWVNPNATRDPYVLTHEFVHTLQVHNIFEGDLPGNGFALYGSAAWILEAHANYMSCVQYPEHASLDIPRWLATRNYHLGSTRHRYDAFRWMMTIEEAYGGVDMVSRLFRESTSAEHPLVTLRRLMNWNQSDLNDFVYDYASRDVAFDYPARGYGAAMRSRRDIYRNNASENHNLWREHTILERVDSASGHFRVGDDAAPQDQGYNVIPLYPTCASRTVQVRFRGHDESDSAAGWRWGFVAVRADGASARYSSVARSSDSAATFTMLPDETALYLVVVATPTIHHDYSYEPGWPKINRFPYEVRLENAVPEGYEPDYRTDVRQLFAGTRHDNGGGWVASDASVAASVFVGPQAVVLGASRLSGNVRVDGRARLERVTAGERVRFDGDAAVVGGTFSDSVVVTDRAVLYDCSVAGGAHIGGNALNAPNVLNALAPGPTFTGVLTIGGDAELGSCDVPGVYLQVPYSGNGRTRCDGRDADDSSNIDVNEETVHFDSLAIMLIGCDAVTGADEVRETISFIAVRPVPASEWIAIELPYADATITLIDAFGRVVRVQPTNRLQKTVAIDLTGLSDGAFIVRVKSVDGVAVGRAIVVRVRR